MRQFSVTKGWSPVLQWLPTLHRIQNLSYQLHPSSVIHMKPTLYQAPGPMFVVIHSLRLSGMCGAVTGQVPRNDGKAAVLRCDSIRFTYEPGVACMLDLSDSMQSALAMHGEKARPDQWCSY